MHSYPPVSLGHPGQGLVPSGSEITQITQDTNSQLGSLVTVNGTTVQLKSTDPRIWNITGSALIQIIRLPRESELVKGSIYLFINKSSTAVAIRSSGGGTLISMGDGSVNPVVGYFFLTDNTVNTAAAWAFTYFGITFATGKTFRVLRSMVLDAGGDNITFTFPNVSAQVASKNIDTSFSFLQTFNALIRLVPQAIGTLPAATTAGLRAIVNDAAAPVFGNTVAAGGLITVPVYSDGTNWKVG